MASNYDKHYQTEHLFGEPYAELLSFLSDYPVKGSLLDLGCGQGRDAIALARLGYEVTGIDASKVGIAQMNKVARAEKLNLVGEVGDMYAFDRFAAFDIILLDSMFHFANQDRAKEVGLLQKIILHAKVGCVIVVCIQDIGDKIKILNQALNFDEQVHWLADQPFKYVFEDAENGHTSTTNYRMIVVQN